MWTKHTKQPSQLGSDADLRLCFQTSHWHRHAKSCQGASEVAIRSFVGRKLVALISWRWRISTHQIGSTDRGYVLCNRDSIWHHTIDQLELFSHSVAWIIFFIDHAGYAANAEFHYALPTSNPSNPSNRYPEGVQVVLGVLNGFQSNIILSFQGWVLIVGIVVWCSSVQKSFP